MWEDSLSVSTLIILGLPNIATTATREARSVKYFDAVDREIFVVKIFRRRPFPTKIKHAKYFVQRTSTYTNFGR